jgi:hypothetical protein
VTAVCPNDLSRVARAIGRRFSLAILALNSSAADLSMPARLSYFRIRARTFSRRFQRPNQRIKTGCRSIPPGITPERDVGAPGR